MRIASVMALLAVMLGAFGAHALKDALGHSPHGIELWEKAVFYHFIHAVMLFVLATLQPLKRLSWWAFFVGIILFSGSLYLFALTGDHWLVALTPFGGVSFMVGWGCLIIAPPIERAGKP